MLQLITNASLYVNNIAIRSNGKAFTYTQLLDQSEKIALALLDGRSDLQEERIAFLVGPSFEYTSIQWGIWRAGGIAVPLCTKPAGEVQATRIILGLPNPSPSLSA